MEYCFAHEDLENCELRLSDNRQRLYVVYLITPRFINQNL